MRICLVNMPFAPMSLPSLALTQLKSRIDDVLGDQAVQTEIHYFNLEFCDFIGIKNYKFLNGNDYSSGRNFGEWYFRSEAFPDLEDNQESYFKRYGLDMEDWFEDQGSKTFKHRKLQQTVQELCSKRHELGAFMDKLIIENRLHESDIVGFTSMFQQNLPSFAMARRIKEFNPNVKILMGGANCESPMGEQIVRHIPAVDYTFSGSALVSFPKFVQHILQGELAQCDQIDGVFSQTNIGMVKSLGLSLSIDHIIDLDYDSFLDKATPLLSQISQKPVLLFETARGCWWGEKAHCTFCGLNGGSMAFRAMKPKIAIPFLSSLFKRYMDRVDHFNCVDNIMPKEYPVEVFSRLEVPENVSIFYEVKSDLSLAEMRILKTKGVKSLQPGIEAMDSSILKLMKKGVTSVKNIHTLKNGAVAKIHTHWNLLFGFPGEKKDPYLHYFEMLPALFHLIPPDVMAAVRFDRYSPYHTEADDYGLKLRPKEIYYYLYPALDFDDMMDLVYYFDDESNQDYQVHARNYFNRLQEIHQQWIERWNGRDDKIFPEVYFSHNENRVLDSRSGEIIIHHLSETQINILRVLSKPRSKGSLRSNLKEDLRTGLDEALGDLIEKRLVFHDRMNSFISLVFESPIRYRQGQLEEYLVALEEYRSGIMT